MNNNSYKPNPPIQTGTLGVWAITVATIFTFAFPVHVFGETADRVLIGYSSELSVRPGDKVEFMVNSLTPGSYEADLVRVINGESQSKYGHLFKLEDVNAPFAGKYAGEKQPLNPGSYVHVEKPHQLDSLKDFTVGAWIYPVFDPSGYTPPDLDNLDPFHPPTLTLAPTILDKSQTIVSRFDATRGQGWALRLSPKFRLQFVVGTGNGELKVIEAPAQIRDWDWSYVAASYDARKGELTVHLLEKPHAPGDRFTARTLQTSGTVANVLHTGPFRIAAARGGPGAAAARFEKPDDVFNGRIQDVRVLNRVLTAKEINMLSAEETPARLKKNLVADFDFARDIVKNRIVDVSASDHEGVPVNIPNRAVRGRFWDGSTIRWKDAPNQYDAITFYADELYDAEWKPAFSYTIPKTLKSGVYAARLIKDGFTEYITFFVAAPKGRPEAKLAFWASDFNYLAYANISLGVTAKGNYPGHNWNEADLKFMRENIVYGTGGVYNTHVDGRNFAYGSRKRPDIHMKPGAFTYNFPQDMHVIAFLEHFNIPYDVITDELVDQEGVELLNQYDAIISSTHPEYVTRVIFDAVAAYTDQGGRFMYIGGNGYFWSVGTHPVLPGVMESRNFFDVADRYLTNGERGGLLVETGLHPGPVFGVETSGMIFNGSSPYRKLESSKNPRASWIFAGTSEGDVFGDYGVDRAHGGAAGFEIDKFSPNNGVPRHALNLATSGKLLPKIESIKTSVMPIAITYSPASDDVHAAADIVFFETPNGGAMLSTGSITWMSSTPENNYVNDVARITLNVIKRFLDPKPFPAIKEAEVSDVNRVPPNPEYEHADQQ